KQKSFAAFPDKELSEKFINDLFAFLFMPGNQRLQQQDLDKEFESLKSHLSSLIYEMVKDGARVQSITDQFFQQLPDTYEQLLLDAGAIKTYDPAADSLEEVIMAYPGFYAITVYRLSNLLWKLGLKILPRFFTEYAHSRTGVDIHPGATIGPSFFIDHGTGIVIGETTVIGKNVKVYQGVTIGALNSQKENAAKKRHPTIEDDVIIYSGATILGGETVVGKNSIIAGNVWLTYSVPESSVVFHRSDIAERGQFSFDEPVDHFI
ncbi:MAG: serine acetyltransferase, partial [Chitinophagaceae bacterium]